MSLNKQGPGNSSELAVRKESPKETTLSPESLPATGWVTKADPELKVREGIATPVSPAAATSTLGPSPRQAHHSSFNSFSIAHTHTHI